MRSLSIRQMLWPAVFLVCAVLYGIAIEKQKNGVDDKTAPELLVTHPRFAYVILAGGDRYLAANLMGFRVLVADMVRMHPEDYEVQARLQKDIAWLNPAHEDNYYIAAATLPWNGQIDAAQEVLRRAGEKRAIDWQPLFYQAFGEYYFRKNPAGGAQLLLKGVERATDQQDIWALQNLAARWIERGYDGRTAAGIVSAMANNSPDGAFRKYLEARALRIKMLEDLRDAASQYHERTGRPLKQLQDLVREGLVAALPTDPLAVGFSVNADGVPIFTTGR